MAKIIAIEDGGEVETYDIWNKEQDCYLGQGNFVIDGLVVHNSILANGVEDFKDLMLMNAMGHPGPMASIPEAIANRDDKSGKWKQRLKGIHPVFLEVLESTYGILCFHEDTLLAVGDGRHLPIRDLSPGMVVCSPNMETGKTELKTIEACGPTQFGSGLKITLHNGYSIVITGKHKLCLWGNEKKTADELQVGDLVAVPLSLPRINPEFTRKSIASWLGCDRDVAYLLGQSVGDLAASGTGSSLCVGSESDCNVIMNWININLPKLKTRKYFHCRCWYLQISSIEKSPTTNTILPDFQDTAEWWANAYDNASGVEIANNIGRSTWFVYDRLHKHNLLYKRSPKSRTTAWQDLLRNIGLKTTSWFKRIPDVIFIADLEIQSAYLAGMIDSDGSIHTNKNGHDVVHYTSQSSMLIDDLCHLLQLLGLAHTSYRNRVFIWDVVRLKHLINHFLLIKKFKGKSFSGDSIGVIPKSAVLQSVAGLSKREAARLGLISRATARHKCSTVKTKTAIKAGIDPGEFRYFKIISIERVDNQQFYNLSVADNHTVVANGIASHQCFQEQLQSIWQRIAGFTAPEAQEARKAVAKKWVDKLKPIESKWINGASRIIGEAAAREYWSKMVTFGRYAFNLCLGEDTLLRDTITSDEMTVKEWYDSGRLPQLLSYIDGEVVSDECVAIHANGEMEVFEIEFDNGQKEMVTMHHKFLCSDGEYHEVREIIDRGLDITEIDVNGRYKPTDLKTES